MNDGQKKAPPREVRRQTRIDVLGLRNIVGGIAGGLCSLERTLGDLRAAEKSCDKPALPRGAVDGAPNGPVTADNGACALGKIPERKVQEGMLLPLVWATCP